METTPTFAQLLRHAIDNRLLDVHTALIGRIEKYDEGTQLADIKPVTKQKIQTADRHMGTIKPNFSLNLYIRFCPEVAL
jgi:hypothetical protein